MGVIIDRITGRHVHVSLKRTNWGRTSLEAHLRRTQKRKPQEVTTAPLETLFEWHEREHLGERGGK